MKKMISRRNFLKAAGVSAAALGLAACGGSSSSTAGSTASSTAASAAPTASGKVYYLNFKMCIRDSSGLDLSVSPEALQDLVQKIFKDYKKYIIGNGILNFKNWSFSAYLLSLIHIFCVDAAQQLLRLLQNMAVVALICRI